MRKQQLLVLATAIAVLGSTGIVLLTKDGTPAQPTASRPSVTVAPRGEDGGAGGHGAQLYPEPIRLTEGDYISPAHRDRTTLNAAVAMSTVERQREKFRGWVNGIFIYDDVSHSLDSDVRKIAPCPHGTRVVQEAALKSSSFNIPVPAYLPPGAFANAGPWGVMCGTEVVAVERRVQLVPQGSDIVIVRLVGPNYMSLQASAGRISEGTINGKRAAFVKGVTDNGYGDAEVLILESWGLTQVRANDVPLDEIQKIARSL